MALVWLDGFDYYTDATSLAPLKGVTLSSGGSYQQTPRASGNGYSIQFVNDGNYTSPLQIWNGSTTVIFGCGLFMSALPSQDDRIFIVRNSQFSGLCDFGVRAGTGKIYATRGGTQIGSDSTLALTPSNTWYYMEAKIVLGTGTSGSMIVKVDGTTFLNLTGVNTVADPAFPGAAHLLFLANGTMRFDDLYMADTTGSNNNDFLGNVKVVSSVPDANGTTNQWTPSAATQYQNVDEMPPNTTDYNSTSTSGRIDDYSFLPVQETGVIYGIQVNAYTQVVDGAARDIRIQAASSGSTTESASITVGATLFYRAAIFERDPNGSIAWIDTAVNLATFGVKLQT